MRVWVIMGGWTSEREISMQSGKAVAAALQERGHEVHAYELRDGRFLPALSTRGARLAKREEALERGGGIGTGEAARETAGAATEGQGWARRLLAAAEAMRSEADVAFLALHGGVGEDGTIQALLEAAGFPYTGSGPTASGIAMDKHLSKLIMRAIGIETPAWMLVPVPREGTPPMPATALKATALGGLPAVVKPIREGSSVGVSIVSDPGEWEAALWDASRPDTEGLGSSGLGMQLLVEKYIEGRELTVGVFDGRVLPVVEIIPAEGFYDFRNKYTSGKTSYQVPADLPAHVERMINDGAARFYQTLGCRGMARIDYRLAPDGPPQCLEINTIPGLTGSSLLPKAAQAVGIGFGELLEKACRSAMEPHPGPGPV